MKKITQWNEFNEKYKNEIRDFMTEEREREFVNDYCNCCEAEGFNKVYWSPYTEWEKYYGKPFKVVKRATEKENDLEVLPMWIIQFEDGKTIQAYPEEIVTSEMKRNECPERFLNKKENNNMIKTWEEFKKKYEGESRDKMIITREREFVEDLFNCYEAEGFNKVFWSPFDNFGEEEYYGKTFKVLGRCPETRNNLSLLPLWDIEFEDGKQLTVEPCEIFTKAMEENGCPKEYLTKSILTNEIEEKMLYKKEMQNLEKNSLYAQLMLKIHEELFAYKEKLYRMTVDEVMEESYKLTMFKEFVCVLEIFATEYFQLEQLKRVIKTSNLLETLYERWIHYESEEQEIYKEFVFGFWGEKEL